MFYTPGTSSIEVEQVRQSKIHKLLMEGKDPTAIIDYGTAKKEKGMSKANVYKTIRLLA